VAWAGWLLAYGGVFSLARGTFHPYYLALLAPPLAALTGIAVTVATDAVATAGRRGALLTGLTLATLALTAIWQAALGRTWPPLSVVLTLAPLFGALVTSGTLLVAHLLRLAGRAWQAIACAGCAALLVGPALWCAVTVQTPESFAMPLAGPPDRYRREMTEETRDVHRRADPQLLAFLRPHRHGERFLLAVPTAYTASPIILRTGEPVIALGGFLGIDPAVSLDRFRQMIQERQLRYVLLVPGEAWEGGGPNAALFDWVQEHGRPVAPTLWQSPENASRFYGILYDCTPDTTR
jgi:4-amino-4-deoxy-L-arabinose transferase-like glycosyltransferase